MASAAKRLIAGDLVAFPTETVYGLGADASNSAAVARIYSVKGRPNDHPLIVHIASMDRMGDWASEVPEYAIALARNFWPGPMTLVLKRSELAGDFVTGGQDTVGVRVPDHVVALALLEAFEKAGGKGVAAPSANRFGHVSPTTAAAVVEELADYLSKDDLVVNDQFHQAQMSTVLMIDISHSMILYGEDRITPAKKVAMALSEFITTRYPKDKLDIIVFGNDARPISIKELPYLNVGPFHTNTVAGLELAMDILRRNRNSNKQIFMITDGKPSCLKLKDGSYYKNSNGLDSHIVDKCYNMAQQARRLNIPITTFMIAQDPYLKSFVQEFTKANKGKAFYTGLKGLGEMIFEDYETNRKKRI